jgi:predicted aspartyl protease
METAKMGRVTVAATFENLQDRWDVERGQLPAGKVRRVEVTDALVDTGARSLSLPTRYIRQLGLTKRGEKRVNSSLGPGTTGLYDVVRLEVQGRECFVDVTEVPDIVPPLIGQIPLESMDFVVDPINQKLIGNPEHGGEHIIELY